MGRIGGRCAGDRSADGGEGPGGPSGDLFQAAAELLRRIRVVVGSVSGADDALELLPRTAVDVEPNDVDFEVDALLGELPRDLARVGGTRGFAARHEHDGAFTLVSEVFASLLQGVADGRLAERLVARDRGAQLVAVAS